MAKKTKVKPHKRKKPSGGKTNVQGHTRELPRSKPVDMKDAQFMAQEKRERREREEKKKERGNTLDKDSNGAYILPEPVEVDTAEGTLHAHRATINENDHIELKHFDEQFMGLSSIEFSDVEEGVEHLEKVLDEKEINEMIGGV